ncbi:MAG: hypothetical protein K8T10_19085 [Candidatus Eremiobacteraeota bacterium]|nr:hypothetical protein [Candidatus Eremiobacteraeota bacterium]
MEYMKLKYNKFSMGLSVVNENKIKRISILTCFILYISTGLAFANIPPQKEGMSFYLMAIPAGLFALFLLDGKIGFKIPVIGLIALLGMAGAGFTALALFVYFIVFLSTLIVSIAENSIKNKVVYILSIFLAVIFLLSILIAIESTEYYYYYSVRRSLLREMKEVSKELEDYRISNGHHVYPSRKIFNRDISKPFPTLKGEATLEYIPAKDGKNYTLYYGGDIFTGNIWLNLPANYPRYDSNSGFKTGNRISPLIVILKKIVRITLKNNNLHYKKGKAEENKKLVLII